jgi:hypothetical protein
MPFHIDTDGTRRRYSFQVQQGFGGNSGDDGLVPLTRLPPDIATDAELAATLAAHVDPLPTHTGSTSRQRSWPPLWLVSAAGPISLAKFKEET